MARKENSEYVLSTSDEELRRLGIQHGLWLAHARKLWWKAGFGGSDRLLDIGCGPGYTSIDLSRFAGPKASVTAIDTSEKFLGHLNQRIQNEGFHQIQTHRSTLEDLALKKKDYDGAYCRWVLCFVKDPKHCLEKISSHLRPGAIFALQEYVDYGSMALYPEPGVLPTVVEAIFKSWRARGGDPDVGQGLPKLLEQTGFRVRHLRAVSRIARPTSKLWKWPDTFYASFVPELVKTGFLDQKSADTFFVQWKKASRESSSFFYAPSVMNIIAEKV
ncbi:MAG: methyltransferase domain-containing protein [Bdellovibrionales bacterium]|nr:methyltransferase domain-containing protein [Bdellovibrionales bacterium]